MSVSKKYPWYFYVIAVLIPVFALLMLEAGLRIAGYGEEIPQWVRPSGTHSEYITLNPQIGRRYFRNINQVPTPHYDGFLKVKTDSVFRVFVMGGSSAAGFPYPVNAAFSHYIRRYLEYRYPAYTIEVVNIALTAVNSYTLRDLFPGVLEMSPDLVIIYAGHNEYYGALGAGSSEFWGGTTAIVNFLLATRDVRVIQLLRDFLLYVRSLFADNGDIRSDATLMERMVGRQLIPLGSDIYHNGIYQFQKNMYDILSMARDGRIPVILGTVTSNIRDQAPFESVASDSLPAADQVYRHAQEQLAKQDFNSARDMYLRAKELDALRFRAPQEINQHIKNLAEEFRIPLVDIDALFSRSSTYGITGNDLMTDHVHPNLTGIRLMGKSFVDAMEENGLVPAGGQAAGTVADGLQVSDSWRIADLDSLYTKFRLIYLKGGWPFVAPGTQNTVLRDYKPSGFIEDLAFQMFRNEITWENAHLKAALWYKGQKNSEKFQQEMRTLMEILPFDEKQYMILIDGLIELKDYGPAMQYLQQLHARQPGAYSSKWLGILYLLRADIVQAQRYLLQSMRANPQDAQVLYNLAGTYINQQDYHRALELTEKCLTIDPRFPGARETYQDLKKATSR